MASEESRIEALAAAIADGKDIDWDLSESSAGSDQERAALGRLHQLEVVARAARALTARWGAFEIRSEIGSGTFGTVYRAWYAQLECEVALKLLHREHARVKEACLLAQIRHPNVVSVLGADTVAGRTGIWMELVSARH
jgi:serine/threonine protein kinase